VAVRVVVAEPLDAVLYRLDGQGAPLDLLGLYGEVGRVVRRLVDGSVGVVA